MKARLSFRRRVTNAVMLTATGLCTVASVSVLFFILGYLLARGAGALNLAFFTRLPVPVGETSGGLANAILGSAKVLLLKLVLVVNVTARSTITRGFSLKPR